MVPRGVRVSEGMVRQLMQDMGLVSIRESAKEYKDKEKRLHKNYLNQQFHTTRPNEVWVSDITCFRYNEKKFYICVIIDLYARKIIGFKINLRKTKLPVDVRILKGSDFNRKFTKKANRFFTEYQ